MSTLRLEKMGTPDNSFTIDVDHIASNLDTVFDLRNVTGSYEGQSFQVAGYHVPGDGGGGPLRVWQGGEAAGTYVDNGGSVIVPTIGDGSGAWVWDYSGAVNVKWFGAKGDDVHDDTSAIQAAIDASRSVEIPTGEYVTSETININIGATKVIGGGSRNTRIKPTTIDQIVFNIYDASNIGFVKMKGMTVEPKVNVDTVIKVQNHYWVEFDDIDIKGNHTTGFNILSGSPSYELHFKNILTDVSGQHGLVVGRDGTGDVQNVFLENCHFNNAGTSGVLLQNLSGLQWRGGETLGGARGLIITPISTRRVTACMFSNIFFDTTDEETTRIVCPTDGYITRITFNSCSFNSSVIGQGVLVDGASTDNSRTSDLYFNTCEFTINKSHGMKLDKCKNINLIGCFFISNGQIGGDGVAVLEVDGFAMIGGSSGNSYQFPATSQTYGIDLDGLSSNVFISGVDLRGNSTGALRRLGTDPVVENCTGFKTRNVGTGSITTGNSSVTVNHGLDVTPNKEDFRITAATDWGVAGIDRFWVNAADATTFTLSCTPAATGSFFFGWEIDKSLK